MRRNLLYLGIAMLLIGVFTFLFYVPKTLQSTFAPQLNLSQLMASQGVPAYLSLNLNESGFVVVQFNASQPVSFYLANASAFAAITGANNSASAARSLYSRGVYEAYVNTTVGVFPYVKASSLTSGLAYYENVSQLQPGKYYALFYASGPEAATISVRSLALTQSELQVRFSTLGASAAGLGAILIFVGIIVIIAGIILRGKEVAKEAAEEAEVQKEYARIAAEERRKKQGPKKRRRGGPRRRRKRAT